jgi:16S rRNA (cytosine967-C5)-methyltransferase
LPDRPPARQRSVRPKGGAQAERPAPPDRTRRTVYDLLRAVSDDGAYANLLLPSLLSERRLPTRDAALATELGYGTLRASGTLDAIIASAAAREPSEIEPAVLDLLRLGAYQILRTRIPPHAAVGTTVDLARATGHVRAAGFVNAVLRKITAMDWPQWIDRLTEDATPLQRMALASAHPDWIATAFTDALGGDLVETEAALMADDERPSTHLIAWPGRIDRDTLAREADGTPGQWSPYAVYLGGGDPGALPAVRQRRAAVQDEGSQLCAIALATAPVGGTDERWLDLCAGPGGKAALLAALATERNATVHAVELHPHRADLIRSATVGWPIDIEVADARTVTAGGYDRVLLDAPCSGLGALRRRPEARWRRRPEDVVDLAALQRELLATAIRLTRPGGVIAYVTCSPHPAETTAVLAGVIDGSEVAVLDARAGFAGLPDLGPGPFVQLWPHRHGTDAMFCALLRRL